MPTVDRKGIGAIIILCWSVLIGCSEGSPAIPRNAQPDTRGTLVGSAPDDAKLTIAFGLSRRADELATFIEDVGDPTSPTYGHYLSVDEVGRRFGASDDEVEGIRRALDAWGIESRADAARSLVAATVTVSQARQLFGVEMDLRSDDDGTQYLTPAASITLPESLSRATEVTGLTAVYRVPPVPAEPQPPSSSAMCAQDGVSATGVADRQAILDRYGISELHERGLRGQGMHLAVIEIEGFSQVGLDAFTDCSGLPRMQVNVARISANELLPTDVESSMDTAIVAAIAPELARLSVIQVDPLFNPVAAFAAALDPTTTGGSTVDVIATSIGYCEDTLDPVMIPLTEYLLTVAAAAGITIVAADGDHGSSGCHPAPQLAVQYPASSAFVTGVGGTSFVHDTPVGIVGDEVAWNDGQSATGGFQSRRFELPAFQAQAGLAGTDRLVPDVAFVADPRSTPLWPVCTDDGSCRWRRAGGTSASSPLLGAAFVLVDQALVQQGKPKLGWVNPLLYQLARSPSGSSVFHDVTLGNNKLYDQGCCDAGPGYDQTTGWGSMNMAALVDTLTAP